MALPPTRTDAYGASGQDRPVFDTPRACAGLIWGAQQLCTRTVLMPQMFPGAAEQLDV